MKTLMLIVAALMISTPVFAAAISKEAVIIKLPRIEVIGKRHDAINKMPAEIAFSDSVFPKNAEIIKLPRMEVIGKHIGAINKKPVVVGSTSLAKNTVIIKLPRIEVIAKKSDVLPSMLEAAEQGNGVFFNVTTSSTLLAKKINIFMPYGV